MVLTVAIFAVFTLIITPSVANQKGIGTLKPDGTITAKINVPFIVTCRINNRNKNFIQNGNDGFVFKIRNTTVEIKAGDIITKTSKKINVSITITEKLFNDLGRPDSYLAFECFYKENILVKESLILIGYPIHQPHITAVIYQNWETLEVKWEKQTNLYFRVKSSVFWKYSVNETFLTDVKCNLHEDKIDKIKYIRRTCSIPNVNALETIDVKVDVKVQSVYHVPDDNKKVDMQRNINLHSIVKPNAVKAFRNTPGIANISLSWESPKPGKSLIYEVSYFRSTYNISNVINTTDNDLILEGLEPFEIYIVQIRCLPKEDSGFWSDPQASSIKTLGTVPAVPPSVTLGGWNIEAVKGSVRDIRVYWQPIPEELRRGNLTKYEITVVSGDGISTQDKMSVDPSSMSCLIPDLNIATSYQVFVDGYTEAGAAARIKSIDIPEDLYRPPYPQNFTAIAMNATSVNLSWNIESALEKKASGFTVFWCRGSQDLICKDTLQWKILNGTTRNHLLTFTEDTEFLYGISMETREPIIASSGMSMTNRWYDISARCSPPGIEVKEEAYSSLTIILTYTSVAHCSGYIWGYRLHYCKKKGNTDQCEDKKEYIDVLKNDAHYFKLEHLDANVVYILTAESLTSAGPSQKNETVEARTSKNNYLYSIFLVIPIIVVIIVILYWRSYCNKKMIDLPEPNKNMPITLVQEPENTVDIDNEVNILGTKQKKLRKKKQNKFSWSSSSEDPLETQDEGIYSGSDYSAQSYSVANSRSKFTRPKPFPVQQFSNSSDTSVFDSGDSIPYSENGSSAVPMMILPSGGDTGCTDSGCTETSRGTGSATTQDYDASAESYFSGASDYCGTTMNRECLQEDLEEDAEEEHCSKIVEDEDEEDDYCPTVTNTDFTFEKDRKEEDTASDSDQSELEETLILPRPDIEDQSHLHLAPDGSDEEANYAKVGIPSTNTLLLSSNATEDKGSSTADEEESDGYT